MPGRRSMIRYCPEPSVTAVRDLSISAGLEASTVTPGNTAPDASRTVPVREACANTVAGRKETASAITHFVRVRIKLASISTRDSWVRMRLHGPCMHRLQVTGCSALCQGVLAQKNTTGCGRILNLGDPISVLACRSERQGVER